LDFKSIIPLFDHSTIPVSRVIDRNEAYESFSAAC